MLCGNRQSFWQKVARFQVVDGYLKFGFVAIAFELVEAQKQFYTACEIVGLHLDRKRSVGEIVFVVDMIYGSDQEFILELLQSPGRIGRKLVPLHL